MLHKLQDIHNKRILISPLNWGLGHVTRIVPVINRLLDLENDVIICCDSDQEQFLRQFFPSLWYVSHKGYPFRFSGKGKFQFDMIKNYRSLKKRLSSELSEVDTLVEKFCPDYLISDQRFGFRHSKVKSVFITHQLNLPVKGFAKVAQLQNKWLISCFDEVWVPDDTLNSLSGKLSQSKKTNIRYLGNLSRFESEAVTEEGKKYKYLGVISGPQPYSDQFYQKVFSKFSAIEEKTAIVVGHKNSEGKYSIVGNCDIIVQPNFSQLKNLISNSDTIVSRSGYSTLMDLKELKRNAILVSTQGQAEQEYLCELHKNSSRWKMMSESEFNSFSL